MGNKVAYLGDYQQLIDQREYDLLAALNFSPLLNNPNNPNPPINSSVVVKSFLVHHPDGEVVAKIYFKREGDQTLVKRYLQIMEELHEKLAQSRFIAPLIRSVVATETDKVSLTSFIQKYIINPSQNK
jgi:hypothetical protein